MKKTILAAVSALSLLSIPLSASARDRDDRGGDRRGDRWEDRRENRGERHERRRVRVMVRERRWVTYRDGRGCIQGYWAFVNVPVWRYDGDDRWNNGGFGASYQYSVNGYDGQ